MANFSPPPQLPAEFSGKKPIHYRLTFDKWCSFAKQLNPAELSVLYYLRTLDPSGERSLEARITDVADAMGFGAFYPDHYKRIHPFAECPIQKRTALHATCEGMGVVVTMGGTS